MNLSFSSEQGLLSLLHGLECGFTATSQHELEALSRLNIDSENIIFSTPFKKLSSIIHCKEKNLLMTFDNEFELERIVPIYSNPRLVLQIEVLGKDAPPETERKFGCNLT